MMARGIFRWMKRVPLLSVADADSPPGEQIRASAAGRQRHFRVECLEIKTRRISGGFK